MAPIDARNKLERIRKNKNKNKSGSKKNVGDVKDLRQLISRKNQSPRSNNRSPDKVAGGRVTKSNARDLRDSNRKLALRKSLTQIRDRKSFNRVEQPQGYRRQTTNGQRQQLNADLKPGKHLQQQQYYVPPHMQHQPPTYIIAASTPTSNLAMDNVPEAQGASILISNLIPTITQSEIIELFGDIGKMTGVNMINQTTALVTYQDSSDAVKAVKVYHSRLLDGKPMFVNMMPPSQTSTTSNVRSRVGQAPVFGGHVSRGMGHL